MIQKQCDDTLTTRFTLYIMMCIAVALTTTALSPPPPVVLSELPWAPSHLAWGSEEDDDVKNPSLVIETITIQASDFNRILRDSPPVHLDEPHIISWQATIDNNLIYSHPDGDAIIRFYDQESLDEFVEVGMGSHPDNRFWVAVQTPKEGYIIVHRDTERGWYPQAKVIVSYTERAGMTVNNGARIVVSNLDIGSFAPVAYSTHGMAGLDSPPVATSGEVLVEFLSGDPSQNVFALFPFYVAAGIGIIVGVLYLTKKRQ